jgi:hypothetical protein
MPLSACVLIHITRSVIEMDRTRLFLAAADGDLAIVKQVLNRGVNVETKSEVRSSIPAVHQ